MSGCVDGGGLMVCIKCGLGIEWVFDDWCWCWPGARGGVVGVRVVFVIFCW